jgi:divalent metal cation (Fe/Co/Zn/Cd) transporter
VVSPSSAGAQALPACVAVSRHNVVSYALARSADVAFEAVEALRRRERPAPTAVGTALTDLSIVATWWLARAKRGVAIALGRRAMAADAFQTTACFRLSIITLAGIGVNALFGWWWADPAAALGMTFLLVKEGREAWQGRDCCG